MTKISNVKSECNIKTLNTIDIIDIKHCKTKNYDISSAFASDQVVIDAKQLPTTPSAPVGIAPLSEQPRGPELCSAVNPGAVLMPPEITYMSASLKASKSTRRTLNVDFRLSTSPGGKFNKIVFNLTDRYREFFSNVPEERRKDWEYQEAHDYYHGLVDTVKWIGKGRPRGKFAKGHHINQKIKFGLACVLEIKKNKPIANIWIEGLHYCLELEAVDNAAYPFRYDSKTSLETTEYLPRGGWE
jgi:hypothetical protein